MIGNLGKPGTIGHLVDQLGGRSTEQTVFDCSVDFVAGVQDWRSAHDNARWWQTLAHSTVVEGQAQWKIGVSR